MSAVSEVVKRRADAGMAAAERAALLTRIVTLKARAAELKRELAGVSA